MPSCQSRQVPQHLAQYQSLVFLIAIAAIAVFRLRKRMAGGVVSQKRIILATAVYFAASSLAVFSSFQIGVSPWYLFAYAAVLAASAYVSKRAVKDKITVWAGEGGLIYARGGNMPFAVWIIGLVLRLGIEYAFIGPNFLAISSTSIASPSAAHAIIIADVIMMTGVGSLTGRNIHLISKIRGVRTPAGSP